MLMTGWPASGRSTKRSTTAPSRAIPASVSASATHHGRFRNTWVVQKRYAPTIMNSPIAKLMTRVPL
jgi:hypothetical protein